MLEHWIWSLLLLAVLIWYSTMTVYVAVRGFADIRGMLGRLKENHAGEETGPTKTDDRR